MAGVCCALITARVAGVCCALITARVAGVCCALITARVAGVCRALITARVLLLFSQNLSNHGLFCCNTVQDRHFSNFEATAGMLLPSEAPELPANTTMDRTSPITVLIKPMRGALSENDMAPFLRELTVKFYQKMT